MWPVDGGILGVHSLCGAITIKEANKAEGERWRLEAIR